jgi:hypothetical protein
MAGVRNKERTDSTGCGRKACACSPMYAWYGARFLTRMLVRANTAALLAEMYRYPIADESNGVFLLVYCTGMFFLDVVRKRVRYK